jgi:MFS family permease
MELAGAVGSFIAAPLADKISRRWALIYSVLVFNLGSAFLTAAQNDSYIVAGRFITGVGIGILANVVVMNWIPP